jgi:hypothetical protein
VKSGREELERQLGAIDVRLPWFAPYAAWLNAGRLACRSAAGAAAALQQMAQHAGGGPPKFVAPSSRPPGEAYEAFVARTASVPSRDNLHDFLNGVVWLQFTCAKRRLNELQAGEIARHGVGPARGPLRDALTLLDENGALLAAPPVLWEALLARQWRRLFVDLRPLWSDAQVVVFGHALLEKFACPRKDLTAHVWCADASRPPDVSLDGWLAAQLTGEHATRKPFTPLPLLGIPGWWTGNEDFSFYDDALVFRPAGRARPQGEMGPAAAKRT